MTAADAGELRTDRLRLRAMTLADTARVVDLYVDPRVNRHSPTGAPTPPADALTLWRNEGLTGSKVECA